MKSKGYILVYKNGHFSIKSKGYRVTKMAQYGHFLIKSNSLTKMAKNCHFSIKSKGYRLNLFFCSKNGHFCVAITSVLVKKSLFLTILVCLITNIQIFLLSTSREFSTKCAEPAPLKINFLFHTPLK